MGRNRNFDTEEIIDRAGDLFARRGYEGTSVDDLVRELGVHRGSLYAAFGSKRGLLQAALERLHHRTPDPSSQDLLLVALLEVAPQDPHLRTLLDTLVAQHFSHSLAAIGTRLLHRAGLTAKDMR